MNLLLPTLAYMRLLTFLIWLGAASAMAQPLLLSYDSFAIEKPRAMALHYRLPQTGMDEVELKVSAPLHLSQPSRRFWSRFTEGVFTLLTGIQTYESEANAWMISHEVNTSDPALAWRVHLYVSGTLETNRSREKNNDGSVSLQTSKVLWVDWQKGAAGVVLQGSDTVGQWAIRPGMPEPPEMAARMAQLKEESAAIRQRMKKLDPHPSQPDYHLSGWVHGEPFDALHSGSHYRTLLLFTQQPAALFQCDPPFIALGKKNKMPPYLLVAREANELQRPDLWRLALLSRLLAQTLSIDVYEL